MNTAELTYQEANEFAKQLFDSLEIATQCTSPIGNLKDNWPCILYNFTFNKGSNSLSSEYRLGVGHVKWPKRYEDIPAGGDVAVFNTLRNNPNAQLNEREFLDYLNTNKIKL